MDPVVSSVAENLADRMGLPTNLQSRIKNWGKQRVILHLFIRDLKTKDLISRDVDHRMHFDPASLNPPLFSHQFSPIRDVVSSPVNSNDHFIREDSGIDM